VPVVFVVLAGSWKANCEGELEGKFTKFPPVLGMTQLTTLKDVFFEYNLQ
jgi:hypothetical protein